MKLCWDADNLMSTLEEKLLDACERGELQTTRELVERKAVDPRRVTEKRDRYCQLYWTGGWTPLHYACVCGHINIVEYLLSHCKCDVNRQHHYERTPLHLASSRGRIDVIKLLLMNSAVDVNAKDNYGYTPLHRASEEGHLNIVEFLLTNSKADATTKTSVGYTPLHLASMNGHLEVVRLLITKSGTTIDVNATDQWKRTPLHLASLSDKLEVVKYIVENSEANIDAKNDEGNTPLDLARRNRHHQVAVFLAERDAKQRDYDIKASGSECLECGKNFAFYRRQYYCRKCFAPVCDNCSKHKLSISGPTSKPERVCDLCFDVLSARRKNESRPLSADELRILNIVLVEFLDELLKHAGLSFETAIADQPATDHRGVNESSTVQPVITKKRVVECLQQIGQHELAGILSRRHGIRELQDYVYKNVYESGLRSEKVEVRLQAFKMILSGVPRSGKTTFWKRLAMKDFQPSETSTSTGVAESHFLSAHMSTEMLLDLHLYSETDTSDLTTEAMTIYKHILEAASTQSDSSQNESAVITESPQISPEQEQESTSVPTNSVSMETDQSQATTNQTPSEEYNSNQQKTCTNLPAADASHQSEAVNEMSMNSLTIADEMKQKVRVKYAYSEIIDEELLAAQKQEIEQISQEINEYFDELTSLLQKGEKVPANIPLIKKICHLIDTGGQRAFLELLPTVTVGKALYLLFFSYEHFESRLHETVQQQGASIEVRTGTFYEQMDIVMQSLICVSSTSTISKDNVALLVGTHVDKVKPEDVECVNKDVTKKVEPFLKSGLVFAEEKKMVLEVSVEKNDRCSNRPEDYRKIIMDIVDNKLSCPESEKLPASWYMFSIILRKMKHAGHSVLHYSHCQQIASKLYIREAQLQSLLSRLHKILGIVMYFPEIHELEDIVICDPSVVYRGLSELIFNSFSTKSCPVLSLRLKNWGIFMYRELKEHCSKVKAVSKGCQIRIDTLTIILQHLGVIAPVQFSESSDTLLQQQNEVYNIDPEFIIPCVLNDALPEELKLQLRDGEACSIVPFRLYFKCGFAPMGGFCYLFTRLISDRNWKLPIEKEQMMMENKIYSRNKATFIVQADQKKYFVTLVSTKIYYEIQIVHTHSKEPFQLGRDGHSICRKVWNDMETVLSNSLNAPLKEYKVACQCTLHGRGMESEHIMELESKPHENQQKVKANCLLDKNRPHPVTVDASEQSVIVWLMEPYDHRTKNLGSVVELSMELLFMATSRDDHFRYQWSIITEKEEMIIKDEEGFKNGDTNTLVIDCFESKYTGTYRCLISSSSRPIVSMSAEVELNLPEPPEDFSAEMSNKQFWLYLNANGIRYKVCKQLKENEITAMKFNLSSFESWSPHLNLTPMELNELKCLLAQVSPSTSHVPPDMKCPVCQNLHVDPCTLQCGHAVCQLCLAHMYKNFGKFCPVCKEPWKVFPAISYNYRANIESSHGHQISNLRMQYTQEDKEVIEEFLKAKREFSLKSQTYMEREGLFEKPLLTFSRHLNHEQLYLWLCDYPGLTRVDYRHDISKLKDAKISGDAFLNLKEDSLEQYGLSTEFQIPLLKIVEEVKGYLKSRKSKIPLQPYKPKVSENTAATGPSSTEFQQRSHSSTTDQYVEVKSDENLITTTESTTAQKPETSKPQVEEIDAAQAISAQATHLGVWKLAGIEECGETSVVVHSFQGQLIEWNGLKLHIHAGSLPEGIDQCTILIKVSLAGEYEIPKNTSLVSAFFWMRCEPQCIFTKPITVEIQHCSSKQDLSKLKIVRALCSQKQPPYKFKPLKGGVFDAGTSYGTIEMTGFSGVGVIEENSTSEKMYYSQLFYRSYHSHQHGHEIHITFTWNTEAHINYVSTKYSGDGFHDGCYQVIELDGDIIKIGLDRAKWTKVMDDQWELQPAKPTVTKAELDVFKLGRGIPNCVLEARPLCEPFPQLLHEITLSGIKPPHHELILSYMPSERSGHTIDAMKQLQSPCIVQPQVEVHPQLLTFSKDMSNNHLAQWLRNHPSLTGTNYEEDISKLIDARINAHVLLNLNESRLERFGVSLGFQFAIMSVIEDLKEDKKPSDDKETISFQQQSPASSVATPSIPTQPTSAAPAKQQIRTELVQQPQDLSTNQPKLEVSPQILEFSQDFSHEQLAVWLTNHPKFVGKSYQQDISKLKDACINGDVFLSLNESRLERSGVSLGFQVMLLSIIESLKKSQQPPDNGRLSPQPESATSTVASLTTRDQPAPPTAAEEQNLIKFSELPTLDELLILKYTNKGKKHKIRIISEAGHKWKVIASLICDDANRTSVLEQKCPNDPEECLRQTLIENFINKKPKKYTQDWNGLIELLDDVDLETLAEKVNSAISVCAR